jgi:glyoxylase-like metal-dependent hydrolase (beta-lactamase superfamily II)
MIGFNNDLYRKKTLYRFRNNQELCIMKIIPLKEGNFSTNKTKDFTLLTDKNRETTKGIKMSVTPFLIITEKDIILLDAGIGWKNEGGETVISEILKKENINPNQVTKVLLSHLHKDHIETVITRNKNGFEATFPNAEIYIQKRELDFAMENQGNHSFDFDTIEKLIELDNIVWMDEDKGNITDEISFEVVGGHTPFMQVFWIKESNEIAFYGADDLPQESYLKYHLAYKSDFDGKKAMALRIKWEKEARENNWKILLYHDLENNILEF